LKYQFNVLEASKLIVLLISITLIGCASPKYNYRVLANDVSEPTLGTTARVNVGESMLLQGRFTEHDEIMFQPRVLLGLLVYIH
jgi:hypothetical protein